MSNICTVTFQEDYPEVQVESGCNPSLVLNSSNSPVLFGCRTGVCGTCLVEVTKGAEALNPANNAEKEILEMFAPGNSLARLACQLTIQTNVEFRSIGK